MRMVKVPVSEFALGSSVAMLQTPLEAGSTRRYTVMPEGIPDAFSVNVPFVPHVSGLGAWLLNTIADADWLMVMDSSTVGAAFQLALPTWNSRNQHVPAPVMVNVEPLLHRQGPPMTW